MGEKYESMLADEVMFSILSQHRLDKLEPPLQDALEKLVMANPPFKYRKYREALTLLIQETNIPRPLFHVLVQNLQNSYLERFRRGHAHPPGPITKNS